MQYFCISTELYLHDLTSLGPIHDIHISWLDWTYPSVRATCLITCPGSMSPHSWQPTPSSWTNTNQLMRSQSWHRTLIRVWSKTQTRLTTDKARAVRLRGTNTSPCGLWKSATANRNVTESCSSYRTMAYFDDLRRIQFKHRYVNMGETNKPLIPVVVHVQEFSANVERHHSETLIIANKILVK